MSFLAFKKKKNYNIHFTRNTGVCPRRENAFCRVRRSRLSTNDTCIILARVYSLV